MVFLTGISRGASVSWSGPVNGDDVGEGDDCGIVAGERWCEWVVGYHDFLVVRDD